MMVQFFWKNWFSLSGVEIDFRLENGLPHAQCEPYSYQLVARAANRGCLAEICISHRKKQRPPNWASCIFAAYVHTAKPTRPKGSRLRKNRNQETGIAVCIGFSQTQYLIHNTPHGVRSHVGNVWGRCRLRVGHRIRRRSVRRSVRRLECVHGGVLWSGGGSWISAQHLRGHLIHGGTGGVTSLVEIDDRVVVLHHHFTSRTHATHAHILGVLLSSALRQSLLHLFTVVSKERNGGSTVEADEQHQSSGTSAGATNNQIGGILPVVLTKGLVHETPANGTQVATSADQTRHDTSVLGVNEGDNTVRSTLRGLDEAGEDDENDDSQPQHSDEAVDNQHATATGHTDHADPEASTQVVSGSGLVGHPTTDGSGEQIHQTKAGGDETGSGLLQVELVLQVRRHRVIHVQLDSEAAGVDNDQNPDNVVEQHALGSTTLLVAHCVSLGLDLAVPPVSLGTVISELQHQQTDDNPNNGRDEQGRTPGKVSAHTHGLEHFEEPGTGGLSDTTSQITPTSSHGVSLTDNRTSEHAGSPELTRHESSSDEANQRTGDVQANFVLNEGSTDQWGRANDQKRSHGAAGTEFVTGWTDNNTS
mmetsp:Transcript_24951/g.42700  ORF Transcript_24951/g.42700 Transcript_24951/m.42700 type:complete len:590 (+) Transcript_24951:659-2428(+)